MHTNTAQDGDPPYRRSQGLRRHAPFLAFVLVVVVYLAAPQGIGRTVYDLGSLACVVALGVGPLLRRARPIGIWLLMPMMACCLVLALVVGATMPGSALPHALYLAAYASLMTFLVLLTLRVGRDTAWRALLDTTAAAVGALLALWTIGSVAFAAPLSTAVVWAMYPIVDVIVVGLATPFAALEGSRVPAWRWLLAGLILQLTMDTLGTLGGFITGHGRTTAQDVGYLLAYFVLAVAATHPSVTDAARFTVRRPPPRRRRVWFIVVPVVPALVALAAPVHNTVDGVVRSALLALILVVLLGRLLSTMRALSRAEAESRLRAMRDQLTGLPNRAALFETLERRLGHGACRETVTALLFLDCDDFKQINDTWGHPAGDALLCSLAAGLPRHLRRDDLLARHGGDEFVIVATVDGPEGACRIAERVLDFFEHHIGAFGGHNHRVTSSIGVAVARADETRNSTDLLRRADIALYEAKARGRGRYVLYDDDLDARTRSRTFLAQALQDAVENGRIDIAYQPIRRGEGFGILAGWEALARWTEPEYGPVAPDVFIPLAEELGLIHDLGEHVLRRSCLDLERLRRLPGLESTVMSVNVSALQLRRPDFPRTVAAILDDVGLPGSALGLEITETLLVDNGPAMLDALAALGDLGVMLCLDDFGTGYASLSSLSRLPVRCVKLDKSLIDPLGSHAEATDQVAALLALLRSLGVTRVMAEGVETMEQATILHEIGCPAVQGYLFGRPAPVEIALASADVELVVPPATTELGVRPGVGPTARPASA